MHCVTPSPVKLMVIWPGPQGVQASLPAVGEYVPGKHALQDCEPKPAAYVPAGLQARQGEVP